VNYTSFRAALVQFKAMVEADQWQLVIPQVCRPIWSRFAKQAGAMVPAKFTPPRFGLLDPAKEIPAMIEGIQGGIRTWRDTIRREGYEPDEVLAEIKAERAEFAKAGVRVTSIENPAAKPEPAEPMPEEEPEEEAA
jgi:capsid protein